MANNADAALPRFFAPDLDASPSSVRLPPDESRHLTRVLRLRPGALVAVFDGRGNEFVVRITTAHAEQAAGTVVKRLPTVSESVVPFSLVQSVSKVPAMDAVVRDATMMGAARIEAVISAHCTVKAAAIMRAETARRWRRIAVASAKQCRRATLPEITEPRPFEEWLASCDRELKLLFVEPSARAQVPTLRAWLGRPAPKDAALVVGPEGGWSAAEIRAAAEAGCVPVTLGGLTLRADAAPVAAISIFRFVWE
jgi:16S rRNA (uracil1498-N3)-methyltransferase